MPRSSMQKDGSIQEWFGSARADYEATKASRFVRKRQGLAAMGAGADFHYRTDGDFLKLMELARDHDRNDPFIGQGINRLCNNVLMDGIALDADTGDAGLDAALEQRWKDWGEDPRACDVACEHTWCFLEWLALRDCIVAGDIMGIPVETGSDDGALQMIEAHRLRTPQRTRQNVVHGVKLDPDTRKPIEYWFTKDDVGTSGAQIMVADMRQVPAFDADGYRQVFHVKDPRRITQTRGVTAMAPIFIRAGMFDDLDFAKLVQAQSASCFGWTVETPLDFVPTAGGPPSTGETTTQALADGSTRRVDGIAPGMAYHGAPGEQIKAFSPGVPNSEYFQHARLILTTMAINLGLPLVMFLMDASETNFSGFRGAVDEARKGFKRLQRMLVDRLHRPVYQWKLRQWAARDPAMQRALEAGTLFKHTWNLPRWPYIEPKKDADADAVRLQERLISHRRLQAERGGCEFRIMAGEIVEDNGLIIEAAIRRATELNKLDPDQHVDWRELAAFPPAGGQNKPEPEVDEAPAPASGGKAP